MSTALVTPEDYKFFDFLAPYRWPNAPKYEIALYRKLVETGDLQLETILENALAITSQGAYVRVAEVGHDFYPCLSDAKKAVSCFRNNNILKDEWTNSIAISGLKNKTGLIRALCYSKYSDEFYCLAIPNIMYKGRDRVEISLDRSIGFKEPTGIPKGKWTSFIVEDFKKLATITPAEAEMLIPRSLSTRTVNILLDDFFNEMDDEN